MHEIIEDKRELLANSGKVIDVLSMSELTIALVQDYISQATTINAKR